MALIAAQFLAASMGVSAVKSVTSMAVGCARDKISAASKHNPDDDRPMTLFKRIARTGDDKARWQSRKELLIKSIAAFTRAIESIESRMPPRPTMQPAVVPLQLFQRAINMLDPATIVKLAIVLFDGDERRAADLIGNLKTAQTGFMECWRDTYSVHFYYRLAALRMAFFCDVYRRLMIDKNLKQLKIDEYFALVLPKLAKCVRRDKIRKRGRCCCCILRDQHAHNFERLSGFIFELLLFTDEKVDTIVRDASTRVLFDRQEDKLASKHVNAVIKWLEKNDRRSQMHESSLSFTRKSTDMAVSIIREIYRTLFESYDPFHFDVEQGYDVFAMESSWIPIKVRRVYGGDISSSSSSVQDDEDPFQLIEERLADDSHLAVITGVPGAGKTLLTQRIAFDYAKPEVNRWKKYDIVLLAEFRSTSDRKHDTIIDLAMHGMEKIGVNINLGAFIRENVLRLCDRIRNDHSKKVLIILDGYDEAVSGQCRELDRLLANSKRIINKLSFHLIVTGRPTGALKRKENELSVIKVIGFGPAEIDAYIAKHFKGDKSKIDAVKAQICADRVYEKMARTPLMLAFICLVYSSHQTATLSRLYESVVLWMIQKKLETFPNLLAELASNEGVFFGAKNNDMTADETKIIAENWNSLEQIKRLGHMSLSLLTNRKYQFDRSEFQPNMNINVFNKIGLIIGNAEGAYGSNPDDDGQLVRKQQTTSKYQFAHRTLQEYFAAMFMTKWQDEYRKKGNNESKPKICSMNSAEVPQFFVEQLLTRRAKNLNESSIEHLRNAKSIYFNIKSSDDKERASQLKYMNRILDECEHIARIHINLNKISISETIELRLLHGKSDIQLIVSDGIFEKNDQNMISIAAGDNLININLNRCQFSHGRLIAFAAFVNERSQQFLQRANTLPTIRWTEWFLSKFRFNNLNNNTIRKKKYQLQPSKNENKSKQSRQRQNLKRRGNETMADDLTPSQNKKSDKSKSSNIIKRKRKKKAGLKFHIGNETIADFENIKDRLATTAAQQYDGRLEIRSLTAWSSTAAAIFALLQSFSHIQSLDLRLPDPEQTYDGSIVKSIANLSELPNLRDIEISVRKSFENRLPISKTHWHYLNAILAKCPRIRSIHIWLHSNRIDEPIELDFLPIVDHVVDVEVHDAMFANNDANMIRIGGARRIDLAFYRCQYHEARLRSFTNHVAENAQQFERIQFFNVKESASMIQLVPKQDKYVVRNLEFDNGIVLRHKEKNKKGNQYYSSFFMELIVKETFLPP